MRIGVGGQALLRFSFRNSRVRNVGITEVSDL